MSSQFFRAKPLQACKLVAIIATLLFVTIGVFGLIPNQGFTSLFLLILISLGLALIVTVETLFTGYRSLRTDGPLSDQFTNHPIYNIVRTGEIVIGIISAGMFIFIIGTLPDGPMAGPGAIGLLFIMSGLGLLILGGSLIRTLTEYYYHRHNSAA